MNSKKMSLAQQAIPLVAMFAMVAVLAAGRSWAADKPAAPAAGGADAGQAPDKDIVLLTTDKSNPPNTVVQDNYLQVVDEKGTKSFSFLVKDILYANRVADYDSAVAARNEGRYTVAALLFTRALDAMANVKWAEEYCNYGVGSSLFDAGHFLGYKGKSKTYLPPSVYYRNAIKANPKSRFLLDIITKLPLCLAEEAFDAEGKPTDLAKLEEADVALKDAEKRIKEYRDETIKLNAGFGPLAERATAQLAITDARVTEKKETAKKATLNDVRDKWMIASGSKTDAFPDLKGDAVDGELRVLVAMKDYPSALAKAKTFVDKFDLDGDPKVYPLLPGAYIVMGKSSLAQAVESEGKGLKIAAEKHYADARWSFLHVINFDNEEYVVTAHYYAGLCYDRLSKIESDAAEKAIREWRLIVKNFPKSKFAAEAAKELIRVGAPAAPAPSTDKKG